MKKLLTIILTVFVSQPLFSQQRYQLDSVVSHWSHYEMRTQVEKQEYDTTNRFLVSKNEVRGTDTEREEGTRHTTQYDERDNELVHIDSYWNAQKKQWIEREKRVKTYDDNDRMLSYTEYEIRGGKWVGLSKTDRVFEEKSVTTTEYRGERGHWIPTYKNTSMFNENGQEILTVNYQWDPVAGDWVYWEQHEDIFLRDSLLQKSVTHTWKDGQWINSEKIVYKYDPQTDQVSDRVVYTGTDDGWQFKLLTQIKYYTAARREENFYWLGKDSVWRAETFKELYLDRHGRETDFVLFLWDVDSSEYRRHIQGMTVYDDQNSVIQSQEIRYDKGRINSGMEILFDFDQDGNLYRQTHRSLIGRRWVVQETREFTFNRDVVVRDEQGETYLSDRARIGYQNTKKNKHGIDSIRRYRHLDGEMVLQEESKYFYSIVD